jgi:hypothetical protein
MAKVPGLQRRRTYECSDGRSNTCLVVMYEFPDVLMDNGAMMVCPYCQAERDNELVDTKTVQRYSGPWHKKIARHYKQQNRKG